MPLRINKIGSGYTAHWTDIEGRTLADIDKPTSRREIVRELERAGCHLVDIYDELFRVDPESAYREEPELRAEIAKSRRQLDALVKTGQYHRQTSFTDRRIHALDRGFWSRLLRWVFNTRHSRHGD